MWDYVKKFILVLVMFFLITFGIKNSQIVEITYYFDFPVFSLPVYGLIFGSALIGIFIGLIIGLPNKFRMRKTIKTQKLELVEIKNKLSEFQKEKDDKKNV